MNKSELRKKIRILKHSVSLEQKKTESNKVFSIIESIPQFCRATNVLLYHSLPDEVITHEFIQKWHLKKKYFSSICGQRLFAGPKVYFWRIKNRKIRN